MKQEPDDEDVAPLTTVDTVDNTAYGITMKMFDFNGTASGDRDSNQNAFMGGNGRGGTGMLSTNLVDGYPTATAVTTNNGGAATGTSFEDLINASEGAFGVNHLFLQSIYNESGYFEYDSTQNFASLVQDDGSIGDTFTVYNQLGAFDGENTGGTRQHGQFMPFNYISEGKGYAHNRDTGSILTNQYDLLAKELSDSDPRKGEPLYLIGRTDQIHSANHPDYEANYFFGMEMSASFTQTASGLDNWGHDIIFEFSGDDDFWLYVDGELVIDLGGIHSAQEANVNFRTGDVYNQVAVRVWRNGQFINTKSYTLREVFEGNYRQRNPEATAEEVAAYLAEYFDEGSTVFKDYTNHTMKIFYMERGAGASNLHMRFNLAAVEPGTFILSKALSGTDNPDNDLLQFPYQIWYESTEDGEFHLLSDTSLVTYEGTTTTLASNGAYRASFTPAGGTQSYEHVFLLKPGESASVDLPDDAANYYVVECGINPDVYDTVTVNGSTVAGTATDNLVGDTARRDYQSTAATTDERSKVDYVYHVAEGAVRTLNIKKALYDVDGTTRLHYPDNSTLFTFRLYLGNESADANALPLANLYIYYVKDPSGNYCKWEGGKFVSLDITTYDGADGLGAYLETLTEAQRDTIMFRTSMNGSISKIPADYTIEVRDLVVDSKYKIEERDYEVPRGYTLREGDGYTRTDVDPDVEQGTPYADTIKVNEDPVIEVRNQKGWGLTAQKVWSDADFMKSHDPIYFGVYVNNELYPGTLHQLANGETEVYYFFDDLKVGNKPHSFSAFKIREVAVTSGTPVVDSDGTVTNADKLELNPIDDNGTLTIDAVPIYGTAAEDGYTYTVAYTVGESTGHNENIRTDTVTNSRPGIKIVKTDWAGEALAGATFTLRDILGTDVGNATYTSADDGLVTTTYLPTGVYTLTETGTPKGYTGLDTPMVIVIDENGSISINGPDESFYTLAGGDSTTTATITVKNRTASLQALKVDAITDEPIEGVTFNLYRQVRDSSGNLVPELNPYKTGLVSGGNGVIAGISLDDLTAGTYYLREIETVGEYVKLTSDVCFTISNAGAVSVSSDGHANWLTSTQDEETGHVTYMLSIKNSTPNSGVELPSTGGPGTTLLYLAGLLLIATAAITLARRRFA